MALLLALEELTVWAPTSTIHKYACECPGSHESVRELKDTSVI